ncbi:metallophosphoesterase [Petrotoga sp. 9PW.55.5.1]|uniref:metallophosphoesterase family protein n=1 Tax=Petrotoga sp. 9PW.55.5.1 TaxID=1308979 RepID=UPI000DC22D71|nr:metallophosphoesterase family protein [Petrotoga sp. 9PW.55.5.1]RAP00011.1 metallophosphoesterase [Petrotoga sp. 9PW.55.5.1]
MVWIISDIHGMYDCLISLLENFHIKDEDKLIFLGDYVDRGPNSKKVLDFLITLSKGNKHIFIKGNHDDMMVDYFSKYGDYEHGLWFYNGAKSTINSFNGSVDREYLNFLEDLPLYYEEKIGNENYLFVHAGINPHKSVDEQDKFDLLWIREEFLEINERYSNYIIIHGHTPTLYLTGKDDVFIKKDDDNRIISIDIDTGCVYGGKLTALGITNENKYIIVQVSC